MSKVSATDTKKTKASSSRAKKTPAVAKKRAPAVKRTSTKKPETSTRRAPTSLSKNSSTTRKIPILAIVLGLFILVVTGASIGLGFSDKGPIDVSNVVEERNSRIIEANQGSSDGVDTINVPVDNAATRSPNGGLRGKGKSATPTPAVLPAETTATSSEEGISDSGEESAEQADSSANESEPVTESESAPTETTPVAEDTVE